MMPNPNYIVQKGDTLYSISKNNNISIEDIIEMNQLTNSNLSVGQELFIPTKEDKIEEEIITAPDDYEIYEVKRGDSLWLISQKYNITVPDLIELNNLQNLTLQIGQKILVPKQEIANLDQYIVQPGDTLWSIAKKFNTSVDDLKRINNLDSNLLSIGQLIMIQK